MTTTRLAPHRYLELLHEEGERLLASAEGALESTVPTCPGWTVDDAVDHVGSVYAHETAVHRVDVESAVGSITPVAEDLAVDGIDELLGVHLADAGFEGTASLEPEGGAVLVRVDAVQVRGSASDVLLWLWGRVADDAVGIEGEPADVAAIRQLLSGATA